MKTLLTCAILIATLSASAQRATIENDAVHYGDRTINLGDTIHVQYGSGQDGKFVFILHGNMLSPTPLESSGSKAVAIVDKVYKSSGRILMRARVIDGPKGGKLFIEPEGAIDKKEIQ